MTGRSGTAARLGLAAALYVLLAAGPARADEICFDDPAGPQPTRVTFDSGDVVNVLRREGRTLTYTTGVQGATMVMTVDQGLFVLTGEREGDLNTFDWSTPLPDLSTVAAGDVIDLEVTIRNATRPDRRNRFQFRFLGVEDYRIGICTYPVHKVFVRHTVDEGEFTALRYVHLPSGLTLQNFQPNPAGGTRRFRAVALQ
jgi:hypothetical protein